MLEKEEYLKGLLAELGILKNKGRHSLYRINDEVSEDTVQYITEYFTNDPSYEIAVKKCTRYENSYDVMISILET